MNKKQLSYILVGGALLVGAIVFQVARTNNSLPAPLSQIAQVRKIDNEGKHMEDDWLFTFESPGTLHESASPDLSTSPYWWLNSGGMLVIEDGIGRTVEKVAPAQNRWSLLYRINNSLDTDYGRYPQNIFRLVSKDWVGDADVSMFYRIRAVNLTDTPNRDAWSGVFLFSRYMDGDNLYYAGVRQDGHAVIKKKVGGVYHTLGETEYFENYFPYDKYTNPNFIPGQVWLGLRMITETDGDGLRIKLLVRGGESDDWTEVLSVVDSGIGGPPHSDPGRFGIRTDYMDVEFDNYRVSPL